MGSPPGGGKWQVSTEGGVSPRRNGNGKELFYVAPDGAVMSVEVSATSVCTRNGGIGRRARLKIVWPNAPSLPHQRHLSTEALVT
jgi:hypothetical protein